MGAWLHAFTWRMAWRDSRHARRRLLLYSLSIMMGVAALVAIGSFGHTLERGIATQSKALLGADLAIDARAPFTREVEDFLRSLGGEQAREIAFASMIQFPGQNATRLVQVRAMAGGFPFYGALETDPPGAADTFRAGHGVLVEESLLAQFGVAAGDLVQLGELTLPVIGSLRRVPGETIAFTTLAPRVFIARDLVEQTGLLQAGSLARYKAYFRFGDEINVSELVARVRPGLNQHRLRAETVARRQERLGNTLDNLDQFLHLVGFIALVLGGIGIASAIHVHVKQRLSTVATLRCLGGTTRQVFAVYLVQGMALGAIGAAFGAATGLLLQRAIPRLVRGLVPFPVESAISWGATAEAMGVGFAICFLFALLPLLAVRRVSPLAALRWLGNERRAAWRDAATWWVYGLIAGGVLAFAIAQTGRVGRGIGFAAGLGIALALLAVVARLLALAARKLVPAGWPYVVRQGLANLHRPNNRTVMLMFAVGLGVFLLLTMALVRQTLLNQLAPSTAPNRPNAILFDIQPDQRAGVTALVESMGFAVLQEAPIVTMRLAAVDGQRVADLLAAPDRVTPGWVLQREYRSTYRDRLVDTEHTQAGTWPPPAFDPDSPVPVSVETGIAEDLQIRLGDSLVFDVQGIPIRCVVAHLREVEWRRVQPNFFIVFPSGVLEQAPAFHVLATRVGSPEESARLQQAVVRAFPNVSAIDLRLIIETLDNVVGRVAAVIRFMALFTVATGVLVMMAAVSTGRFQRQQECALLRTLGASRRQLASILAMEYISLGALAGLTGTVLAVMAGSSLARWVFKSPFQVAGWEVGLALLGSIAITLTAGVFASRGVGRHSPLALLRAQE